MKSGLAARVTIGIPVYNGASYIDQALEKLCSQSYGNFVICISDNNSTDETWDIIQKWEVRDSRIVLHRQRCNIGPRSNFGYLIENANTEYFMWHAHDDWLSPNYIEELVEVLDRNPDCQLASASVRWLDPDGQEVRLWPFPDLDAQSVIERASVLLREPVAGWMYGLFRIEQLKRAFSYGASFPHVLAWDRVILLDYILRDSLRGTPNVELVVTLTTVTRDKYYPKDTIGQVRILVDYTLAHAKALFRSPFSVKTKLALVGALLRHRRESYRVEGYHRLCHRVRAIRRKPYRHFVKLPARWLCSRIMREG